MKISIGKYLFRILNIIIGREISLSFETKALRLFAFFVFLFSSVSTVLNYFNEGTYLINLLGILSTFIFLILYRITFSKINYYFVFYVLLGFTFGSVFLAWYFFAGFSGSAFHILIILMVFYSALSRGIHSFVVFILTISFFVCLCTIEYLYPGIVIDYKDNDSRFFDIIFTVFFALIFNFAVIKLVMNRYLRFGEIEEKNTILTQKNKIILEQNIRLEELNSALTSEIQTRIDAEEKIKKSLNDKEILLKEIHHRVKNNLQVISSLLYLQSNKLDGKAQKEIFSESQNRIKSMALVHEKLYKSNDLAGIELQDYIHSLVNYLLRSYDVGYNKIRQEINVDNIFLSIDKSIPFGLIINELVTNSLKYAFVGRDEGLLRINIKRISDGVIFLSVFDDGIGIPANFDIKSSNSLGLRLVQTLVTQLEGTFRLHSDGGTEFIIEFLEYPTRKIKEEDIL